MWWSEMRADLLVFRIVTPETPAGGKAVSPSKAETRLLWSVKHHLSVGGIRPSGMLGSSVMLSNEEIRSIVIYIRNFPKAGNLGNSQMYG
jgi:hypothetical protein